MDIHKHKGIVGLIPIIIIFLVTAGAALYLFGNSLDGVPRSGSPWSGACTQDAMQCPDGSYVSRTGPGCAFAACPGAAYPPPNGGSKPLPLTGCTSDTECLSWQTCVALQGAGTVESGDGGSTFMIIKGECRMKIGGACGVDMDCGEGVCYSGICAQPVGRQCKGPYDTTCGGAYECVQGCGPPVVFNPDASMPSYSCQLKGYQRPCPKCLAQNTAIATPSGEIAVQDVRAGTTVWTADASGARVATDILEVSRTPVPSMHRVMHLVLEDGRELLISPGHPTADGRTMGDIKSGDTLDGSRVATAKLVSYEHNFTYDLLPASATGFYWADGILIGSTLSGD